MALPHLKHWHLRVFSAHFFCYSCLCAFRLSACMTQHSDSCRSVTRITVFYRTEHFLLVKHQGEKDQHVLHLLGSPQLFGSAVRLFCRWMDKNLKGQVKHWQIEVMMQFRKRLSIYVECDVGYFFLLNTIRVMIDASSERQKWAELNIAHIFILCQPPAAKVRLKLASL